MHEGAAGLWFVAVFTGAVLVLVRLLRSRCLRPRLVTIVAIAQLDLVPGIRAWDVHR